MGILGAILPLAGAAVGGFFGGPAGASAGATAGSGVAGIFSAQDANEQRAAQQEEQNAFNSDEAIKSRLNSNEQALVTRQFNREEAATARSWSAEQADKQMDFQSRMSNTAYQRAVQDMELAGLNPMLAYSQGGASSPGGAMGSAQAASAGSPGSGGQASSAGMVPVENVGMAGLNSASEVAKTLGELQRQRGAEPLSQLADAAVEVIKELRKAIGPVSEAVSGAVARIEEMLKQLPVASAGARETAKKAIDAVSNVAEDVKDVVRAGSRYVGGGASSAVAAGREAAQVVQKKVEAVESFIGGLIHGEKGVQLPESRGRVPREAQGRVRRNEWQFNYSPEK